MRNFDNNELLKRVDEIMFYIWDPIEVSPDPYAWAEYESYVAEVRSVVEQNDTVESISEYLARIIKDYIEILPDRKRCDYTAKLLLQNKQAIIEGCA